MSRARLIRIAGRGYEVPFDAIDPNTTRAALAVLCGAKSVREVCSACGIRSTSVGYLWLSKAKAAGLVAWEPGRQGTLRSLVFGVRPVPTSEE